MIMFLLLLQTRMVVIMQIILTSLDKRVKKICKIVALLDIIIDTKLVSYER